MILYTLLSQSGSRLASAVIGGIVILTGVYFLLRNAFGLVVPPIDWDLVWPIVVIASGVAIVSKAAESRSSRAAAGAPAEVETPPVPVPEPEPEQGSAPQARPGAES